jgi:WD40 repeat protein
MMRARPRAFTASLLLCVLGLVLIGAAPKQESAGFRPLLNNDDLHGWSRLGGDTGTWAIDGGILSTMGQSRCWLLTDEEYTDFELRLEYRLFERGNSGVLLRGSRSEDQSKAGIEIQILDDERYPGLSPVNYTGAIFDLVPRSRRAGRPVGEWNAMRIVAKGTQITVLLNDVQVVDADLSDYRDQYARKPWLARPRGRIGLQSWEGRVEFRNILVKSLSEPAPPPVPVIASNDESGFQPLFNGKDLTGWKVDGAVDGWRVDRGEIVAVGDGFPTSNFLLSNREYQDFALRFDFQVGEKANSGVAIRAIPGEQVDGRPRNLEVQIHDDEGLTPGQGEPTGSLFWSKGGAFVRPAHPAQLKPRGEWNTMEVEVHGRGVRVAVNGQNVLGADLQPLIMNPLVLPGVYRDKGRIGLQKHTGEARFRNVRIKDLPPQPQLVLDAGGHTGSVRGMVFTRDSKQLISVSHDKTIRIWDVETGRSVQVLRTPTGSGKVGEYFGVALSPDGKTLAAGGWYGRIFLIDLPSGRMLHFLVGHADSVFGLDFSPDGLYLASASADRTVRIWDVPTGQVVKTLTGHSGYVDVVRFSPDGRKIATGARDKKARIFSADDGALIATVAAEAPVKGVDWSRDGQVLVTGDNTGGFNDVKGTVCLWKLDGTQIKRFDASGGVTSLCSTNSGAILYTWSKYPHKGAVILDQESGNPRVTFDKSWNDLECSAISPDGRLAATGGFDAADLRVWRTGDGQQVHQLRARGSVKWSAGWGADGTTIAWGNAPYRDRPLHFNDMGPRTHAFDLKNLQMVEPTGDVQIGSTKLDDLQFEGVGSSELRIKRAGEIVTKIDTNPFGGMWRSAAWVDRDRIVIGSNFGDVSLVDANSGKLIRRFVGHVGTIWAIAPSPDRRRLLTASQDSTMRIWSLNESSPLLAIYFGDDGEWIAGAQKGYYAASPGGEQLFGWHVSNGLNSMSSYYPAPQFRKTLYRPDLIKRIADASSLSEALAGSDASAGRSLSQSEVAEILPPRVAITSPASSKVQIHEKTLVVEAVAHSVGTNPITEMRVLIDGRPVPNAFKSLGSPMRGEVRARWNVEVPPGSHRLTVEASSTVSKGYSEPLDVVAGNDDSKATGKLYLLVIGINDYLFLGNRFKLDSAVPDARSIHQSFQNLSRPLFRSVESRLLLDRQATRANVLDALRWLKQSTKPGDKAVVFYAGHGDNQITGQFYILPVDAKLDDLRDTGISDDDLKRSIGELPCSTVLMLDACYSGSFGQKRRKTRSLSKPTDALAGSMINDYGLATLCGARDNQEAIEEGGHGFFTQALTQGMAGEADTDKDGVVELYELLPFVCSRVRKLSAGDQVPTFGLPQSIESFPLTRPRQAGR